MKISKVVLFLFLVAPKIAYSYGINLSGGVTGFNSVGIPNPAGAHHWDSFAIANTPGQGEHLEGLTGNHSSLGSYVSVLPEAGELETGTIQLSFHYQILQQLTLNFANYQPTPCDFHYDFRLAIRPDQFSPAFASYNLSPGTADLVLPFEIGAQVYLDFILDPTPFHNSYENWSWHPSLIDPSSPGLASLELSGTFTPISLQVVPEPSGFSLCVLGFTLIGTWTSKTRCSKRA